MKEQYLYGFKCKKCGDEIIRVGKITREKCKECGVKEWELICYIM